MLPTELAAQVRSAFQATFHADPEIIVRAPGRVNLIGEHTDYNAGYVLPVALDRAVWLAASICPSPLATIRSLDFDQSTTFRLTEIEPGSDRGWIQPRSSWASYPAGVAWALREAGLPFTGLDAVFASNIAIGAGLSSSAAVEVAFATAWKNLYALDVSGSLLAKTCQRAENEFVGVACGIMDQMISVLGQAGQALLLDCRTLGLDYVAIPDGVTIVVADTKVERTLAGSAYNERRAQCEAAVRILQKHDPAIQALRDVSPGFLRASTDDLPPLVLRRARHVVEENRRVLAMVAALRRRDLSEAGRLMRESHISLRDDYEVSCRELDAMVEAAWGAPGVIGSRMTGGGFGGCAVSLVQADQADRFVEEIHAAYQEITGIVPAIYACVASEGAGSVSQGSGIRSREADAPDPRSTDP